MDHGCRHTAAQSLLQSYFPALFRAGALFDIFQDLGYKWKMWYSSGAPLLALQHFQLLHAMMHSTKQAKTNHWLHLFICFLASVIATCNQKTGFQYIPELHSLLFFLFFEGVTAPVVIWLWMVAKAPCFSVFGTGLLSSCLPFTVRGVSLLWVWTWLGSIPVAQPKTRTPQSTGPAAPCPTLHSICCPDGAVNRCRRRNRVFRKILGKGWENLTIEELCPD